MKKPLRLVAMIWCVLCGLAVPPALLAVVLARSMGVLDLQPVVDLIQGTTADDETDGVAEAGVAPAVAGIPASDLATPIEAFAWRRRLEQLGAEVGADAEALAARETRLEEREAAQDQISASLAGLLGDLLGEEVDAEAVTETPEEWRRRLAARRSAEAMRPRLLKLIQNIENEAFASIIADPTESNGLDEDTVARLMEELSPSRAGEVLTELGRRDPALASRIIARLERTSVPLDSEGESPR